MTDYVWCCIFLTRPLLDQKQTLIQPDCVSCFNVTTALSGGVFLSHPICRMTELHHQTVLTCITLTYCWLCWDLHPLSDSKHMKGFPLSLSSILALCSVFLPRQEMSWSMCVSESTRRFVCLCVRGNFSILSSFYYSCCDIACLFVCLRMGPTARRHLFLNELPNIIKLPTVR